MNLIKLVLVNLLFKFHGVDGTGSCKYHH